MTLYPLARFTRLTQGATVVRQGATVRRITPILDHETGRRFNTMTTVGHDAKARRDLDQYPAFRTTPAS